MLIGGINWGLFGLFKLDVVSFIPWSPVSKMIYIIIGLSAIYLSLKRDVYLPFLGETVYPCDQLVNKIPDDATVAMTVRVPAGAKVVYWASEHSKDLDVAENPWKAYLNYSNSGVTTADANGNAVLKVREPTAYRVPLKGKIEKHIHYRYCGSPGMLSEIHTV